jgi:uncharacterized protein YciI
MSDDSPLPEAGDTWLYTLHPVRVAMLTDGLTDAEEAAAHAHWERLVAARAEGTVLFGGRTLLRDETNFALIAFRAPSAEEARAFAEADPAVVAGVFDVRVYPFEAMDLDVTVAG